MSIKELFEVRRLGYLMSPVKVVFKSSISNIRLGTVQIEEAVEGSSMSVPLWAANLLEKHGFVEVREEGFDEEFYRSVAKEKLLKDSVILSQMSDGFYVRLMDFIAKKRASNSSDVLSRDGFLKIHNDASDLVNIRLRKILHYARAYSDTSEVLPKLTLEEKTLLQVLQKNVKEFSSAVFGEGI
ncbi:MAG: hypothetical protein ACUVQ8_03395 [Nitrososphaeria archaeon]